jgi:hypothetical protein
MLRPAQGCHPEPLNDVCGIRLAIAWREEREFMMHETEENRINAEWDTLPDNLKAELILQVFDELSLVRGHARLLVLTVHGYMELMINALIDHHLKNRKKVANEGLSYPLLSKLLILNELGILRDSEYKVIGWFGMLRNDAVHKPAFEVTEADLRHFSPEKFRDPANFHDLCVDIIGSFWNRHASVFGQK